MSGEDSGNKATTVRRPAARRAAMIGFAVCFVLFALNVLFGSLAITGGWADLLALDRVAEFLVLFASAVFLTLAALASEAEERATSRREPSDQSTQGSTTP